MKCDLCSEAIPTVFLTLVAGGTMVKVDLCEPCAQENGVNEADAAQRLIAKLNLQPCSLRSAGSVRADAEPGEAKA